MIARHIRVTGAVQGVGFRPFVWRLAQELALSGWVRNDAQGVEIAVEGAAEQVGRLLERLRGEAPPLARIEAVEAHEGALQGACGFQIVASRDGPIVTSIGHDTAPCPDCLRELFDPANRRWRHAFINCTHCGPRYTVTRRLPYDREQTSLAEFPLCADCAREYAAPADRRFHAETNCCPSCGPRLALLDGAGRAIADVDPLAAALERLQAGGIVAVKGVGGFHLMCDARNAAAVARLRERKAREEKPFAVLLANSASARALVELDTPEQALLESAERPIVLLRTHARRAELPQVAPGLAWLGVMLPSSPLQYLLLHEAAGRPAGSDWLQLAQSAVFVCTSANRRGEPLLTDNAQAVAGLAGLADVFLVHDRAIVARCDDSVVRLAEAEVAAGDARPVPQFIRRARGYTPRAIRLARAGPSVLACGGQLKNTLCITRGDEAFVSQHIGDLDNAATCAALVDTANHLLQMLDVRPDIVAHDLHPEFFSTRHAAAFAAEHGVPLVGVQHHHAHIAAILAEHGVNQPVIGLALDGFGLGDDGGAWGGELLHVDGARCQRLGHLRPLPLPGGDRAAREPWRVAAALLHDIGCASEIEQRFRAQPAAPTVAQMLARGINAPPTSSMGRAFDAVAGLLGVRALASYEGQAAMLLEGLAEMHGEVAPLAHGWQIDDAAGGELDLRPLYRVLGECRDAAQGAALFHATLAAALGDWAARAADATGVTTVACGGGCFLNTLLSGRLVAALAARGLRVLMAQAVPPNDGGLSLGQAWVARLSMEN